MVERTPVRTIDAKIAVCAIALLVTLYRILNCIRLKQGLL